MNDEGIELLKRISEDIHAIRVHIRRLTRHSYRQDLDRVASTPERQEIWRNCNGTLSIEEIAQKVGVSSRAVQYFVKDAVKVGLVVIVKRGYPKRTDDFDEIPTEWKPLRKRVTEPSPAVGEVSQQ